MVGCGRIAFDPLDGSGIDEDGTHSGTRLKVIWNESEDGTRAYGAAHDTLLGVDCALGGLPYCSPFSIVMAYADAACTQPIAYATGCAPFATVARDTQNERYYERGADRGITDYYTMSPTCTGPLTA